MKKRNKFLLASVSFGMCMTMLGCAGQTTVASNINMKMDKIESTINAIDKIDNQTFDIGNLLGDIIGVSAFNPNNNGYGNVGYNGFNPNNNGYGNFNPNYNMGYYGGNNYYRNYGFGNRYYGSNVDTYRPIHKIEKVANYNELSLEQVNLCNSCKSCQDCNLYCDNLKADIEENVDYTRKLAEKINSGEIELSSEQIESVNELLKTISTTCSKINMSKSEITSVIGNLIQAKTSSENCTTCSNSKLVRALGCLDTRNSHLQTILNSLLQLECVVDGQCLENCLYGNCPNCDNENCTDGNCENGNCENGNCVEDENSNTEIEKITEHDNDKVVKDNLLETQNDDNNNEVNNEEIDKQYDINYMPTPKPEVNPEEPVENTENTNSILNENDQENNKSLTA